MNILISGASGLIGQALMRYLPSQGHKVYPLKRNDSGSAFSWQPGKKQIYLDPNIPLDAVINLNGVSIGDKPWSKQRKLELISSRTETTQLLAHTLALQPKPIKVLINASAIGFYGDTGSQSVDETSAKGHNFLTDITTAWEQAAQPAISANIRTVFIRSGIVLSAKGGALKKMLLPYKFGLGGRLGSGQQYMSWISLEDEIRAIDFILKNEQIQGPVNLTSPNPVTNSEFSQVLADCLTRPALLPLPEFIVKLLFAEMGELLLLGSANVVPKVLLDMGFQFNQPQLVDALTAALKET